MKRIHIIGRKNHGKTTLVVELVEQLTAMGLRVGTIKHTHHEHELDTPGKDSHRHRQAGAATTAILSPGMNAVFWTPPPRGRGEPAAYEEFAPHFASCELVVVEGDTLATSPKVEVWRAAAGSRPMAEEDETVAAVISDDPVAASAPVWRRSDVRAIAGNVLRILEIDAADQA